MDGELFRRLYKVVGAVASRAVGRRCTFSDFDVLLTFVLAAVANKPLSWACRRENRPLWCWRVGVPTPSTMSRRTRTRHFQRLLLELNAALVAQLPGSSLKFLDGKPLLVAGHTRDRDARRGRAAGGWGDGYRLHALFDACGRVDAFAVTALGGAGSGEATVARELLVPACDLRGALVLGDGNFDSNPLYAAVADAGGRLEAPRRKAGTGLGHGREQHPDRLRAVEDLERTAGGAADFRRLRLGAEQCFGLMAQLGLGAPPPWVRRLRRVRMWAMGRVIVYHAHLLLQDQRRDRAA